MTWAASTLQRAFLALALAAPLAAQHWRVQYFYDEDKSSLFIRDIKFASAKRGVAVGYILTGKHEAPTSLVTADGGAHWQPVPLEEMPVSLFFLDENTGWLVTSKGLWVTKETGRSWTRLPKPPADILSVSFTSEQNGWAAGGRKGFFETHDGGQHWTPVAAAAEPPGDRESSAYTNIAFATPEIGIVTGWNIPPSDFDAERPDWMDPEAALRRPDLPHLSYTLSTHDGGKTWKSSSASLFGETERIFFSPTGAGLALTVHSPSFQYPSEVYRINWHSGRSATYYRDPKFAVSDIWLAPDGTSYLAGDLATGKLRNAIPGKVRVLESNSDNGWNEMAVDYRATANRVILSAIDRQHMWLATDTGMILDLEP